LWLFDGTRGPLYIPWLLCTGKTKHKITGDANHYGVIIDEEWELRGLDLGREYRLDSSTLCLFC